MKITIKKLVEWNACYDEDELKEFKKNLKIKDGVTPLEFIDLDIKTEDKIWTLLRPEIIPEKELHLLGCKFAEAALKLEMSVIKLKKLWLKGKAMDEELEAARSAGSTAEKAKLEQIKTILETIK